tara:strand:- start:26878 stop:27378 length:501 start_codon:yes stop_codon:yes gene_type:complete
MPRAKKEAPSLHPKIKELWIENLLSGEFGHTRKTLRSMGEPGVIKHNAVGVLISSLIEKRVLKQISWLVQLDGKPDFESPRPVYYYVYDHGRKYTQLPGGPLMSPADRIYMPSQVCTTISMFRKEYCSYDIQRANAMFFEELCRKEFADKKITFKKLAKLIDDTIT